MVIPLDDLRLRHANFPLQRPRLHDAQILPGVGVHSGAKNDDEIMAAIACLTLLQIEEILKSLYKDICNNPITADAMKQMYRGEKMNTFEKKVIQYWRAAEGKEVDEAIEKFTDLEKIILLRVLHKWCAPELVSPHDELGRFKHKSCLTC